MKMSPNVLLYHVYPLRWWLGNGEHVVEVAAIVVKIDEGVADEHAPLDMAEGR